MNEYFQPGSSPATSSPGSSAVIRVQFANIAAGFDKLPIMAGNADEIVTINSTGTALIASGFAFADLATLDGIQTLTNKTLSWADNTWVGFGTGATKDAGTLAGEVLLLAQDNKLPAMDAGNLTNIPGLAAKADANNAVLTGAPTTSTPIPGDNSSRIANTLFVNQAVVAAGGAVPSASAPLMDGVASAGVGIQVSRDDHVHPSDTSRAPSSAATAAGTSFTPVGGVAATDVQAAIAELDTEKASLASPTFTGDPRAPTTATSDNDTSIATTAFVQALLVQQPPGTSVSNATPLINGTAAPGTGVSASRDDHVHPSDTSREVLASKDASNGYVGLTLFKLNMKNAAGTIVSWLTNTNTIARTYTLQNRDGILADNTDLSLKAPLASPTFTGTVGGITAAMVTGAQTTANEDVSGGYPGLTGFTINLKNAAGTIISFLSSVATVARTWTFPDKSGTVAMTSDITGVNSGTNTGDETAATIRTKYGTTGLLTGILKNTVTTGAPVIATNADLPVMSATVGGAVPTPPNNTTTFLRGDGTFAAPVTSSKQIQSIGASVASNALTISASALALDFRSTTLGSGTVVSVSGSPANIVVPASATLGTISTQRSKIAVLAFNNAGTIELAVVNMAGGNDLSETGIINTTAISAAATAANVIYSTTARTNVAYRVIGYVESTQATAGTWATAPSTIQGEGGQALAVMSSLGYGQGWQSLALSSGVTAYNTYGKPITIYATQAQAGNATVISAVVNGYSLPLNVSNSTGSASSITFVVPVGQSFSITSTNTLSAHILR